VADDNERADRRRGLRTSRLEAFSDGVFAIAVTLLILDIAVPAGSSQHLLHEIGHRWPSYLAYAVSFATIGSLWLGHSLITEYVDRADGVFLRLNLVLLLVVSFLPFPTRLVSEYFQDGNAERVAATIYGVNLLLASALISLLWRYAVTYKLIVPDIEDDEIRLLTNRIAPGLGGYLTLIIIGLFWPGVAVVGYLVIALFLLLPIRRPMDRGSQRRGQQDSQRPEKGERHGRS
jgi:uncharacterized membrane protein